MWTGKDSSFEERKCKDIIHLDQVLGKLLMESGLGKSLPDRNLFLFILYVPCLKVVVVVLTLFVVFLEEEMFFP